MSISILGGKLKGRKLQLPPESITRPTSTMLRRKIFDAHQNLEGKIFIDLFAGSGAVGIEAFSRGASEVFFNEKNSKTLNCLKKNLEICNINREVKITSLGAENALSKFITSISDAQADSDCIIFIDPPYENKQIILSIINEVKNISKSINIEIWIESDRDKGWSIVELESKMSLFGYQIKKIYEHSTHYVMLLIKSEDL